MRQALLPLSMHLTYTARAVTTTSMLPTVSPPRLHAHLCCRATPGPQTQHRLCCTPAELGTHVGAACWALLHGAPHCLHSMLMLRDGWANGLQVRGAGCSVAWLGDAGHGLMNTRVIYEWVRPVMWHYSRSSR